MQFSPIWNDAMMQFSEHEASWRNELLSEIRCRELGMFLVSFQIVCVCFQIPTLVLCALSWTVSFRNFYVATSQNWTRHFEMNCSVWDAFVSLILSISLVSLVSTAESQKTGCSLRYFNSKVQVRKNKTLVFSRRKSKRELNEFPAPCSEHFLNIIECNAET